MPIRIYANQPAALLSVGWGRAGTIAWLLFTLIAAGCGGSTSLPPTGEKVSYRALLDWTRENGVPGSVLLVDGPGGHFHGATGLADVGCQSPMTSEYEFRIGSISKMFVGIVAAQMIAERKLNANARIVELLPASITDHITNAGQITLMQLLRHMSGIYDYELNFSLGPAKGP